jgi:hypothetical protein
LIIFNYDFAFFRAKRTPKGTSYRFDLKRARTALRAAIAAILGTGCTIETEEFVAGSFASDWLLASHQTYGALILLLLWINRLSWDFF